MSNRLSVGLNFDYSNIRSPYVSRDESGRVIECSPMVNMFALYLMFIGMGEITEWNYIDVYARIALRDHLIGPIHGGEFTIELKHIKDCIGLKVNAAFMSDATFLSSVWAAYNENLYADNRQQYQRRFSTALDVLNEYNGVTDSKYRYRFYDTLTIKSKAPDVLTYEVYRNNDDYEEETVFVARRRDRNYRMVTEDEQAELEALYEGDES